MIDIERPDVEPSLSAGYPPDTLGLLLQGTHADPATGSTVELPARREYDIALLFAQIAMAPASPGADQAAADLLPEDVRPDPAGPFRPGLLEDLRRHVDRHCLVLLRLPPEVPAWMLLRAAAATLVEHAEVVGRPRLRVLRYDPAPSGALSATHTLGQAIAGLSDSIVLIPRADRALLGGDLRRLSQTYAGRGLALLATTQQAADDWQIGPHELDYWVDLVDEQAFSPRFLALTLLRGLRERQGRLAPALRALRPDSPLPGGPTVVQAAPLLGSPLRIHAFLRMLEQAGPAPDAARLLERTRRLSIQELVQRWYEQLSRRDQLLAISLCLLSGLTEAQLFPALEDLFERVWGLRAPGQPMLDAIDLAPLRELIGLVERGLGDTRVEPSIDGLRLAVLPAAASAHRRHIQYAQLWLARLIRMSLDLGAGQPHPFFGPPGQRGRLRSAFADALADLALTAPAQAQPALLLLVADNHDEARRLLARALGRWRTAPHCGRLAQLVDDWQSSERARALVGALQGVNAGEIEEVDGADDLLRATGMLALAEALRGLPPGPAVADVIERLARLVRGGGGRLTLRALREELLPILLRDHVSQAGPLLHELARYPELRADLSDELAEVYGVGSERAQAVSNILQGWLAEGLRAPRAHAGSAAELQLVAAASALGAIDYRRGGPLSLDGAWRFLRLALDRLDSPAARAAVLAACMRLAGHDPRQIRWALGAIRPGEEAGVVASLTEICRQQRDDMFLRVPEPHMARERWPDGSPKSQLERVLIGWLLRDPRQGRADPAEATRLRLLVWETFVSIARTLDLAAPRASPPEPAEPPGHTVPGDFYRRRVLPLLLEDQTDPDVLPVVRQLSNVVLDLDRRDPATLDQLLEQWRGDHDLEPLASGLIVALRLDSARWWGLSVVEFGVWMRVIVMKLILGR